MRVVGTLSHENHARRLAQYLTSQGIGNNCEVSFDSAESHMSYQIWIHDEDKLDAAQSVFVEFQKNPTDPKFDAPIPEPELVPGSEDEDPPSEPRAHRFKPHLTHFLIALCAMMFFLSTLQEIPLRKEGLSEQSFLMTPLQSKFMYDLPPAYEKLEAIIEKYELAEKRIQEIPPEIKTEITEANNTPYWKGIYAWVASKIKGEDPSSGEGTLFYQIRKGEIWRLITPCVLHKDLLHILFNMLWLWYLGRPIEERIGPFRTLFLTLIAGIGTNTMQYFMSGPFFIGYSGIVTALAGFIWMRERIAPWEGYPLNRATILFLLFFIAAIFAIQIGAFLIQIFSSYNFAPNIANTAHIAGAVIGAMVAKSRFFAQRVKL
jgi:GlpG protein